jgi:hypothetical protein
VAALEPQETAPGRNDARLTNPGATLTTRTLAAARQEPPRAASVPPLKPATVLRSVQARMVDGALRIFIETDGEARFRDFTLGEPSRIVIDITGVRNVFGNKLVPVVSGLVDRMRIGEPAPGVVRIVLDLKAMIGYQVRRVGSTLVVTIGDTNVASKPDGARPSGNH